jgi:hypothetical protein
MRSDATGAVRETRADQPHSVRLEHRLRPQREWLRLTVLRFFSRRDLRAMWPEYLLGLYHSMRTANGVMEAALARSIALAPECPVAARLVDYWSQHIDEEAGHDEWLLADMRRFGMDTESALQSPVVPEVAELMGTLHFWVLHEHPVGALAYFHEVERYPPTAGLLDWLAANAGIPADTLVTFHRHATIDIAHGRELEQLLDELPLTPAHHELLAVAGSTALRQLSRIVERLLDSTEMEGNP